MSNTATADSPLLSSFSSLSPHKIVQAQYHEPNPDYHLFSVFAIAFSESQEKSGEIEKDSLKKITKRNAAETSPRHFHLSHSHIRFAAGFLPYRLKPDSRKSD